MATDDPAEGDLLMQARRLAGHAITEQGPTVIEDVAVPRKQARRDAHGDSPGSRRRERVRIATVGHAGDGNVHRTCSCPT